MRIGAISDLHVKTVDNFDIINNLIKVSQQEQLDLLIIAGDISEDVSETIKHVNKLNTVVRTLYVPGNHDLWNRNNQLATKEIYNRYLADPNCLLGSPFVVNPELEIVGHIGWYDYSLGDTERYSNSQLDTMTIDNRTWNDKNYINWNLPNPQVCKQFDNQLETLITANDKQKIVVTHMISNPGFKVIFDEVRKNKSFFNSFLGSDKLYRLTLDSRVSHAICGHVHYRKTITDNQTDYICRCLGDANEWSRYSQSIDCYSQIKSCLYTFTV